MAKLGPQVRRGVMPVMAEKYERPSSLSVNLKKHAGMDGVSDVGKMIHFKGHGKVTSIHKDDMGHHMEIDIHHVAPGKE